MASDFGMKVSKDGVDVLDELSGSINLFFDTNANSLKEALVVDSSGSAGTNHNMGEVPLFLPYYSDSYNLVRRISTYDSSGTGAVAHANSTQVVADDGMYYETRILVFYKS